MSLGNWTAQEPGETVRRNEEIIMGERRFGNDANKYPNVPRFKIYHSKPLRGNVRRARPRVIHSESNLGSQLLPPRRRHRDQLVICSTLRSPPLPPKGARAQIPDQEWVLGVAPPRARPSATSPDANHLTSIQTRELSFSLSPVFCGEFADWKGDGGLKMEMEMEMERMVLMEIGDRCGRNWEGERVILIGNGIRKIVLRPQQRRHECYHSGRKGRRG